ncbi:translocation/assembly module TamB domain-containing protein [Actinoallomurus soli]|uniref:hypothetical protein n=1 Tax=Actinoallomurus soli TaxID=2952535 RepID=UPI002092BB4D|nr:hypothetical protein [Actinoallomurus soli]MCO5967418.1 hypothetical protein [Actinoallomurus soli]
MAVHLRSRLQQTAAAGTLLDLRTGDARQDDPARGTIWGAERSVHADVLIDLLTGQRTPPGGRLRAVKLRGARITGSLDLSAVESPCQLALADCHFEQPVSLREAGAPAIRLPGCHLPGLTADQVRTTGDLDLDGIIAEGAVTLNGARIGGRLSLAGARLSNPGGYALTADGLTVDHDLDCKGGFSADGKVNLRGAAIGGTLYLTGAHLSASGTEALTAARLTVGHDMFCEELTADGEVRLPGARIGGRLDLSRARLTNSGATALTADRLSVDDGVLSEGLTAEGRVRLPGARIGGDLVLAGARLANPGATALFADSLTVEGGMSCANGFTAQGEVRMLSARIGEVFSLEGATISNPGGRAFYAFRLTVGNDLYCRRGFSAEGEIQLSGARIGGLLHLAESSLSNPGGQALDLEGVRATGLLLLPRRRPDGIINLTNAQVDILYDEPGSWPTTVRLHGFAYNALANHEIDVRDRLRWLTRHPGGYVPQIYDQLAAAYRRAGDEQAARKVAVAKQRRRRAVLNPAGRLANWLLYLTVGYGYRTWLAAIWLAGLLAFGTGVFTDAYPHDLTRVDAHASGFNAFGYTLDTLLPIVDLGQQKGWQAHGAAMYWSWGFTAAGWILTTAVVAGLTGILKRD